ncbi:nematocidal protein AidA [Streptomyces sp. 8K308]|uniref:inclusion body family protein n=1 Tax=Streptomyces sp. 8K308 TaxID=2530388 RepID=UPI0010522EB9|nr:inclusion body family protein [Streptomyces sp. 8K308]TDC23298.1 nematocidal protein AidA [Streptomyces sp. 8K308]
MAKTINVLIAFDASSIKRDISNPSKNPDQPTSVGSQYIYMTTRHDHVVNSSSGANLDFEANPGDTIRWRETTLSLNADYSALLYAYVSSDPDHKLLEDPRVSIVEGSFPIPKEGVGGKPDYDRQSYNDHFWTALVKKSDASGITYHFSFQIHDDEGNLVGYFKWDPHITIKPR